MGRLWTWLPLHCLLVLAVGCGGNDTAERHGVTGTVTFQESPLEQGTIEFAPIEASVGTIGGATIENGRYEIPAERGLAPGKYRVRISSVEGGAAAAPSGPPGDSRAVVNKERIPAEFNAESTLEAQVTADGENTFDFPIP